MKNYIHFGALILSFAVLSSKVLFAQISFSENDILSLKGSSRIVLLRGPDSNSAEISIGSGGMNQVWDFRNIDTSGLITAPLEFLDPSGGYKADLFPEANLRQSISAVFNGVNFVFDSYLSITSNQFKSLGSASNTSGNETIKFQEGTAPLPMTMGTSWQSISKDTTEIAGIITITMDSTLNMVDGYGTLRIPAGDFESLRVREHGVIITTTKAFGFSFGDTIQSVSYTWLTKEHLQTFSADSTSNGRGKLSQMVSTEPATSVTDLNEMPEIFLLEQNYPNPFNPSTKIKYSISNVQTKHASSLQHVTLKVYDILGNEVAALVNKQQQPGNYEVEFDGTNISSGVYFYQLKADKFISTRKMILLR